jgi:F-type H+-transporting ATPase subunit delta
MRGASRASLAQAAEALQSALDGGASASRLGDELFEVTDLLDREAGLRRTLSDPTRRGEARAGLAQSLLGGQIGEPALAVLRELVSGRWSAPDDLPDATARLAAEAVVAGAESRGTLDELEDELFRFSRIAGAHPQLRVTLSSPYVPAEGKQQLLDGLLARKATAASRVLISRACLHPRGRSLDAALAEFASVAAQRRERLIAEVRVATALPQELRDRLTAALAAAYGHEIHLNVIIDPQVVGGMTVRIGDEQIDGSIATRLAVLRRKLAS